MGAGRVVPAWRLVVGSTLALSVTIATLPVSAQMRLPSARAGEPPPLPAGFHELVGTGPSLPFDDLQPLVGILGAAQVVGLGEAVHTSGGFYRAKHRLLRFLVEEMEFRAFAIESNWVAAEQVAAYVAGGAGTAREAMDGGLFPVWYATEVVALVEWLRAWNDAHPDDPVVFFGFDIQQPEDDGPPLYTFVHRVGGAAALVLGIRRCAAVGPGIWFPVPEDDYLACLAALDGTAAFFTTERDMIVAATSAAELDRAWVHLVSLRASEGLYWGMTNSDIEAAYESRDRGMAEVFLHLWRLTASERKTVVWAHNWHLARNTPAITTDAEFGVATSMGTHLADELGGAYAPIALTAHRMRAYWPWVDPEVVELVADSGVEARLHDLRRRVLLIDSAAAALCPPGEGCTWTWPDFAESTADWELWRFEFDPADQFRAVVQLDRSPEMVVPAP